MRNVAFYNVIGFPDETKFKEICMLLDEYGSEFMEIGIPSNNPHKEGPQISKLHTELKSKVDANKLNELLIWIKENTNLKIVLMTYFDGFKSYSLDKISKELYSSILCVDNDLNEYPNLRKVKFYHNDMSEEELESNLNDNADFCYVNSGNKVTGGTLNSTAAFVPLLEKLRKLTDLPLYVGFGIKNRENIKLVLDSGADGAIVGSEFIRQIHKDKNELVYLKEYLNELSL